MKDKGGGSIVAVDSMTLVWGIKEIGTPEKLQRARWLFQHLQDDDAQIIVPAIVLSEYLTPVDPKDHRNVIAAMTKRFIVAPFDVKCASMAATLFSNGKDVLAMAKDGARKCLRADCMIIATAFVHGARTFYTNDGRCRKLAEKVRSLEVLDLPTMPSTLFGFGATGSSGLASTIQLGKSQQPVGKERQTGCAPQVRGTRSGSTPSPGLLT